MDTTGILFIAIGFQNDADIPNESYLHTVALEFNGDIQYATFAFGKTHLYLKS